MAYVVVFGAGQVGAGLAARLAEAGHRVRVVRRSPAVVAEGVEVVAGDARDAGFVRQVTEGADTIFHCMNPATYAAATWAAGYRRRMSWTRRIWPASTGASMSPGWRLPGPITCACRWTTS